MRRAISIFLAVVVCFVFLSVVACVPANGTISYGKVDAKYVVYYYDQDDNLRTLDCNKFDLQGDRVHVHGYWLLIQPLYIQKEDSIKEQVAKAGLITDFLREDVYWVYCDGDIWINPWKIKEIK